MWELITGYWHWGVVLMLLRTLPRVIWRLATAVPLLKWSEDKIAEMVDLDRLKDRKIDFLEKRVGELERHIGLTGSSSASPELTRTSTTTPTSSPAGTALTDSTPPPTASAN
jgi:hypothetical protein